MREENISKEAIYQKVFEYFEKNLAGSLSDIAEELEVPMSALYFPLKRIVDSGIVEKLFPGLQSEALFVKCQKHY